MESRNRGKKKPNLHDLSRLRLTDEERDKLVEQFLKHPSSPIVTAILGQALLENELDQLLRAHFARRDDDTWAKLTDERGPLATFYSKIVAAHAFGICNSVIRDCINTVRQIRNAFAHSKKPLDFSNELIIRELQTVSLPVGKRTKLYKDLSEVREFAASSHSNAQRNFIILCMIILNQLLDKQSVRMKAKKHRLTKRLNRLSYRNQLAQALMNSPPGQPVNYLTAILENRTVDPSPPTPLPSLKKDGH